MTSTNHYINIQLANSFHLAFIYAIFFFRIKPMQLDRFIINLLYVHEIPYCLSLSFNEALQVVWVRGLSDINGTASWSHIPLSYLKPVGGLFLLQCNFDLKLRKVDIPIDFYKEALCA